MSKHQDACHQNSASWDWLFIFIFPLALYFIYQFSISKQENYMHLMSMKMIDAKVLSANATHLDLQMDSVHLKAPMTIQYNLQEPEALNVNQRHHLLFKKNGESQLCVLNKNSFKCYQGQANINLAETFQKANTVLQDKEDILEKMEKLKRIEKLQSLYDQDKARLQNFYWSKVEGYEAFLMSFNEQNPMSFVVKLKNVSGMQKPLLPSLWYGVVSPRGNLGLCSQFGQADQTQCYDVEDSNPEFKAWIQQGQTLTQIRKSLQAKLEGFDLIYELSKAWQEMEEKANTFK